MKNPDTAERWARLRFAVIGKLLASPPPRGKLQEALTELAKLTWQHPTTGLPTSFGFSTVERWFYEGLRADNPIQALRRRVRSDAGLDKVLTGLLLAELEAQYRQHPSWSRQLHADNLRARVAEKPTLGSAPSYSTVRRCMNKHGWRKRPKARTPGQQKAALHREQREVRSYEVEFVHSLWHFDFHEGSRCVSLPDGRYRKPWCLCILDDCSRLACHVQWYLCESAETLTHGLHQAFLKRGLPRAALSDNGGAMLAAETTSGFEALSVTHETTLAYSPYQNGKQEVFWGQIEGRLLALLEAVEPLTLSFLNHATQAWVEQEYNRSRHDELGVSPLDRLLAGPDVVRPCIEHELLRLYFTRKEYRTQRRSDGTVSIAGVRFEVPARLRHCERLAIRYAHWDLTQAYVVDPRDSTKVLARILPQDKQRNADGRRRVLELATPLAPEAPAEPVPALMRQLLADYAATGLPPAYLPHPCELNTPAQENDNHA
jgi:transposase InsO family protein